MPPGAELLVDGSLLGWVTRAGRAAGWAVCGGECRVVAGAGDIMTRRTFRDFFLHLEFCCPRMPNAIGQAKANSGVFLQGRYEVQILDSYGVARSDDRDCGAIYGQHAPRENASLPAAHWQSFDAAFVSARDLGRGVIAPARVTVQHNGVTIHDDVALAAATPGALDERLTTPGPLLLQDHRAPVVFRNVWVIDAGVSRTGG